MTIREVFKNQKQPLLNIYFTAGFPQKESLLEILPALEMAGADIVEVGIPYSDPLSDGPTIQNSSAVALSNGISVDEIFDQLSTSSTNLPLVMMGYFNTVLQYGLEKFCKKCSECGVSGIILPDLPMDIYEEQYKATFEKYNLSNVFLVTPETSVGRIRLIDNLSDAFIYAVSSSSTTGTQKGIRDAEAYLERLQKMNLKTPVMVGFNIGNAADFQFASSYSQGGIIGSAYIKHIANSTDLTKDTQEFIHSILQQ
jgi:tryptophan synthase alpha chain